MRVRYTPRALAEREAIFNYLDRYAPQAAGEIKAFVAKAINDLGDLPRRGPVIREFGVHAHWLGRYPFIVYHRVGRYDVAIIHIRYASRPGTSRVTRPAEPPRRPARDG
jgi:toxin ParE1/3/4